MNLHFKDESDQIRGAVMQVYQHMGSGFLEPVYQECLEQEFELQGIPYIAQPQLQIEYKKHYLKQTYKPDLVCFNKIILELKAVRNLTDKYKAPILNYLKITGYKLGFLINFGNYPQVEIVRLVNQKQERQVILTAEYAELRGKKYKRQ